MYTADDFNTKNDIEREFVQHVIDNVDCFESRYQRALEMLVNTHGVVESLQMEWR